MTLSSLLNLRPACLTDEDVKDIDKVAFYVKQAESYMSYLEGVARGMQDAIRIIQEAE